jgi:hypothetical protein
MRETKTENRAFYGVIIENLCLDPTKYFPYSLCTVRIHILPVSFEFDQS